MSINKPYSLGKSERLKSRKQIDALFENGKKITLFPFRLLYRTEPGKAIVKAGFTVSSKNFPHAVDRNRIKRLTRESYRLQKKELESLVLKNDYILHLFFIYTGRETPSYEETHTRIKQVMDKLLKTIYETHTPNT
jgi:ribonuclease P protein component